MQDEYLVNVELIQKSHNNCVLDISYKILSTEKCPNVSSRLLSVVKADLCHFLSTDFHKDANSQFIAIFG